MSSEQTEPKVWLDHPIYIWQDNPSIAEDCLLILPGDATIPINHGPASMEEVQTLASRYPSAVQVKEKQFQDEIAHRLTEGKRPRRIFYADDREKVKIGLTPEQLEYVEALENVAHNALIFWTLAGKPGKQRQGASDELYDSLVPVDFLDTSEER